MAVRRRALIVDDDDPIRAMLTKIVRRQDIEVDTARDGAEAIERIDGDGYDVILLDLMMPRVDGFKVLEHIQQTRPEELHRTIIATAIAEPEILRKVDVPVFRIHTKPFELARLVSDIRECVDGAQGRVPY
jgi:CheY-like chemotaxis protein